MAILFPLAVLVVIELGLRLCGFGYPTAFLILTDDGKSYRLNEHFRRQYYPGRHVPREYPLRLEVRKPANTVRVFVFGESAALGTPNPSFGFARMLGVMLREGCPGYKFRVVNAAVRGINSHIIREIARDCAEHEPDIAIVYAGNNEVVGFAAPSPASPVILHNVSVIRARQALRRTRLAQLFETCGGRLGFRTQQQDMNFFRQHRLAFDDPRRAVVYRNFEANLEDICRFLTAANAKVLLATVPVNVLDCPPLGSLHRRYFEGSAMREWERWYAEGVRLESARQNKSALEAFQRAAQIDDHFAELHYRMGRCLFALGRFSEGSEHFILARDRDALQFRADGFINARIRTVAAKYSGKGVVLVDAEKAMAGSPLSVHGLPGNGLFLDHVHPRFAGDHLLACTFYEALKAMFDVMVNNPGVFVRPPLSREECAELIAFTGWDELEIDAAIAQMLKRAPFLDQVDHDVRLKRLEKDLLDRQARYRERGLEKELEMYRRAIQRNPDDWELHHNLGMILNTLGRYDAAVSHFEVAAGKFPESVWCLFQLAETLVKADRLAEAEQYLGRIRRLDPGFEPAEALLNEIRRRR